MDKAEKQAMLNRLEELTNGQFDQDEIRREGTALILPENMSTQKAIDFLESYKASQEAEQVFSQEYEFRYLDGLIALKNVLRQVTGVEQITRAFETMFGKVIPPILKIEVDHDVWDEAPQGEFPLEVFEGTCLASAWKDEEKGILFRVVITAPKKYQNHIRVFLDLIQAQLETRSIYRGKAITAEETPSFLDLRGVDPTKVVYSDEVMDQLDANVWSLLRHTDVMRESGLPLKRSVLLHGPYGTGKTLAAYLTAQQAVSNGWTFIFVRPGKDKLSDAMATAKLYQPAVVFFEDVDVTSNPEMDVSHLLDIFDGIQAKGTELVAVFTTNHAERIHKGLVRPGRLDAVVEIGELDVPGIERLIRATVDEQWLPTDLDVEAIAAEMVGFMPAFVKEAIDRTIRYSIARTGQQSRLTNADFIKAARGLQPQLALMLGAADTVTRDPLTESLKKVVRDVLDTTGLTYDGESDLTVFTDRPAESTV